jgi:hypothetical protein
VRMWYQNIKKLRYIKIDLKDMASNVINKFSKLDFDEVEW